MSPVVVAIVTTSMVPCSAQLMYSSSSMLEKILLVRTVTAVLHFTFARCGLVDTSYENGRRALFTVRALWSSLIERQPVCALQFVVPWHAVQSSEHAADAVAEKK